jgi:hypothetical protein
VLVVRGAMEFALQGRREPACWTSMRATEGAVSAGSSAARRLSHCFAKPSYLAAYDNRVTWRRAQNGESGQRVSIA